MTSWKSPVFPMLSLPATLRAPLWTRVIERIEQYLSEVEALPVSPELNATAIREYLGQFDFSKPVAPEAAVDIAAQGLTRWQVHTPHPAYFGLFNPAPTTMGIAADALVAAFNPQMAAWSHNPFATEVEMHLIRAIGQRFGYEEPGIDGTFCSGGMEANHTAVVTALSNTFPGFPEDGAAAIGRKPVMYVSAESHHSFLKSARLSGIGSNAVRLIPVDSKLRMCVDALQQAIAADRASGHAPFLVGATAGTTSAGAVDPLDEIAQVCEQEQIWLHTDAAWGGAAVLLEEMRALFVGLERSDSITFDAHKWFSVPMGAGLYLTRHKNALDATFRVITAYMPKDAASMDVVDPHLHSMQWSRRFIGLKLFLSLLVAGWDGYAHAVRHQTAMGELLRQRLRESGWEVVNDTPLPVICFVDPDGDEERQREIANAVVSSGLAWISPTVIAGGTVIRACITHFGTMPEHVERLVAALEDARSGVHSTEGAR